MMPISPFVERLLDWGDFMDRLERMIKKRGRENTVGILENEMEFIFMAFREAAGPDETVKFLLRRIRADSKRLEDALNEKKSRKRRHLELVK